MTIKGAADTQYAWEQMEQIARLTGMQESAITDFVTLHMGDFEVIKNSVDGTKQLVHAASGMDAHQWTNTEGRTKFAHYFPQAADPELAELAFGDKPTLTAQMTLAKSVGQAEAARIAAQWGSRLGNLKPGKRPDEPTLLASDRKAEIEKLEKQLARLKANEPAKAPGAENPWLGGIGADGKPRFNLTRQGAIVKALGPEKAAQIARSAKSYIGASKPHPDFDR
jgi:hypothetical protein